jgi:hypothetical protein
MEAVFSTYQMLDGLAGGLGGLVQAMRLRPRWLDFLFTVLISAICAIYLSNVGDEAWNILFGKLFGSDKRIPHSGAFLVGLTGKASGAFVMDVFRIWTKIKKENGTP